MKEKKGKKEKGKKRLAAASTDRREGAARQLHGGTRRAYCLHEKLKSSMGSNFSHAVVLSPPFGPPPLATWPSPIWPVSYAPSLFRTAIALTFPLCLVPAFFFFSPFISNLCRTMSTAISPSPPPPLARTLAIPRRRRHQPRHCHLHTAATSPIP